MTIPCLTGKALIPDLLGAFERTGVEKNKKNFPLTRMDIGITSKEQLFRILVLFRTPMWLHYSLKW